MQSTKIEPDLRGLILVVITCAWLAGILLDSWLLLPLLPLFIGAGAALVLVVLLWHDNQGRLFMLIALCLLLGAWRHASVSPNNDPQAISNFIGANKLTVRGTVATEPTLQGKSRLLIIDVSSISNNGGNSWQKADGKMEAQTLGAEIEDPYGANYGDSVELQGRLQHPPPHSTPDIFAAMTFPRISVNSTGGNPIIGALYHLRVVLAGVIAQSLPQPEAALLIAILLGLRTPALKTLTLAFNETGTAHLIVASGFKVTILAGLVDNSTKRLYEKQNVPGTILLPAQKRQGSWRRWLAKTLVVASIAAYTILNGAGPAALRAGIMGILLVIAPLLGRLYNFYTALALAALLMSIFNPFVLWDAGFQLSLLGTLGIVLLTPLFQRLFRSIERVPLGYHIAELISVTLAAQTATLPISVFTFHQISVIAPIANVLTVPLLVALFLLGILVCGTGLLFAPLGIICGWVAQPLLLYMSVIIPWCAALERMMEFFAASVWGYMSAIIPWCAALLGACLSIGNLPTELTCAYYAVLALFTYGALRRWPRQHTTPPQLLSRRTWRLMQLGAALLVILATGTTALAAQPDGRLTLTFLSVGPIGQVAQGEAILIHTPDNKTILIDGGPDSTSLAQELDKRLPFWQRSLDLVMLTTARQDHLTGLQDIVGRYQVGEVLDAGMLHPNAGYALWRRTITQRNLQYVQVRQGTTIAVGTQVKLQVLWPPSPLHKGSSEVFDNSLVVRLIAPGLSVLLLGTAALSNFALTGLLTGLDQSYLRANIVQFVGESSKPFPPELGAVLQAAQPAQVVITPAALSPKQRKATGATTVLPASALVFGANPPPWQTVQTAEVGTVEISSGGNGWNMSLG